METTDRIDAQILALINAESRRWTPAALESALMARFQMTRRQSRQRIRALVQNARLVYRQQWGGTFLAPSLLRPVNISERIWVCDADVTEPPSGDADVLVRIADGDAFGEGRHPSTRVALQGVDLACRRLEGRTGRPTSMLDVGTGSGILIIAGVLLGMHRGLGIDTDANARFEARRNVRLNGLPQRITVGSQAVETIDGAFDLLAANLRLPTLVALAAVFQRLTDPLGWLVLSGYQQDEEAALATAYRHQGFEIDTKFVEAGWCGAVLVRADENGVKK